MVKNNILYIILGLVFMINFAYAQPKENSPYSRFGLGDMCEDEFTFLRSTGLSSSYYRFDNINIVNPASYGYINTTVFDIGFYAKNSTYSTGSQKSSVFSGNLDYFSLAIPLINPINDILERKISKYGLGLNLTLKPYSIAGYNITSKNVYDEIGTVERFYQGSGGTYKATVGLGGKYKNFGLGFNIGYFFGKLNYERQVSFLDITYPYTNIYTNGLAVRGLIYNIGGLYSYVLNKKEVKDKNAKENKITFGFNANTRTNFTTIDDIINTSVALDMISQSSPTSTIIEFTDSIRTENLKSSGKLPSNIGFGINYNNKNKWVYGFNFSSTLWDQYRNELKNDSMLNSYSINAGIQFTPNENSFVRYFDRVSYRFGLYYRTDPRVENKNQLKDQGLHFGAGFPITFQRKNSTIDADISIGQRGSDFKIKENYIKFSLSFNINDSDWFVKRKYY